MPRNVRNPEPDERDGELSDAIRFRHGWVETSRHVRGDRPSLGRTAVQLEFVISIYTGPLGTALRPGPFYIRECARAIPSQDWMLHVWRNACANMAELTNAWETD